MSAPKGNNFWQKRIKHGRYKIFELPQDMLDGAYEYFKHESKQQWKRAEAIKGGEFAGQLVRVPIDIPFTIQGLCIFLGTNTKYFNHFETSIKKNLENTEITEEKQQINKDFSNVISHIRDVIDKQKLDGALVGQYPATLVSQLIGLSTKTETALTGKDGGAIKTEGALTINIVEGLRKVPAKSEKDIQEEIAEELGDN